MNEMSLRYVPAEFAGRARAFVRHVQRDEKRFNALTKRFEDKMWSRLKHHSTLRKEVCQNWLAEWRAFRGFGQPPSPAELKWSKRRVEFRDVRVMSTTTRNPLWDEDERETGVSIMGHTLIWEGNRRSDEIQLDVRSFASFSLHALGRFFQKSFVSTDEALAAAIWSVASHPDLHDVYEFADTQFSFSVPKIGGQWFGRWAMVCQVAGADELSGAFDRNKAEPELGIRTYHCDKD